MKISWFLFFCLITSRAPAASLSCTLSQNGSVQEKKEIEATGVRRLFSRLGSFQFFLREIQAGQYSIEVYDEDTPSRSYAEGALNSAGDSLNWSLWRRDILLEMSCRQSTQSSAPRQ